MSNNAGKLVLAGTPIGDAKDASTNLKELLATADVIAAEDTRRLRRLCERLGVVPVGQVISYFEGNEAARTPGLVNQLQSGATVALVTDAGMPGISDPGYRLVRGAIDAGVSVEVAPGPSAALAALVVSGLPVRRFCFEGFAPRKTGERRRHLESLAQESRTMIFFEAPHRLADFLDAAILVFGDDRDGAICRELTKPHQEVVRGSLGELAAWARGEVRGEICVVIGGCESADSDAPEAVAEAVDRVRLAVLAGMHTSTAIAQVAKNVGVQRKNLYNVIVADLKSSVGTTAPVDIGAKLAGLGLPDMPAPLPRAVTDSHTHMDSVEQMTGLSPDDNLAAAAAVGVSHVVQIGCDAEESAWSERFAASHPQVVAAVAIGPNDAARLSDAELEAQLAIIDELAGAGPHVRAVGETGLDNYRTRDDAGRGRQRRSFEAHIAIAAERGLTLAIHDREAHDAILRTLDDAPRRPPRVIMHCFSGDGEFARACIERGYWLSFPGTITFKDADNLRAALAITPADRLLVETDAPYLTPAPARGRPNASYLIAHTVRFIADLRGNDLAALCDTLSANAAAAYGGAWGITVGTP